MMPFKNDAWLMIGVLVFLAGCKDSEITIYRIAKDDLPISAQENTGESQKSPAPEHLAPGHAPGGVHWVVPHGWQEAPVDAASMRLASFRVPAGQGAWAEVSVVVLPGPAGGPLANVNRWRGQIGLEPIDEPALTRVSQNISSAAGDLAVVDFVGVTSGIVAGILEFSGQTWFFKLTGSVDMVGRAKPSFLDFLKSLHDES
ncbi:MAG: hypothetical protein HY547_00690 [Elusimicrobia bacterium]|nr:hypothetical protein [Elusimicrobiota bacterium]